MSKKMLIEVHVGKRYGISRLNCGEDGQVKDVMIDSERYNRISSQSKKKVWREHLEEHLEKISGDTMERVYRTRAIKDVFEKEFKAMEPQVYKDNASEMAAYVTENILECKLDQKSDIDTTKQILVVNKYDIKDILDAFCEIVKNEYDWAAAKKALKTTKKDELPSHKKIINILKKRLPLRQYGVECALFGRMTTSGIMEVVESAMCVNHSYSFGKATLDSDYFTVVDTYLEGLKSELDSGQSGAGYLDEKDFASHVYYEYASIDVGKFYDNLSKGVDMTDEHNAASVKKAVIEAVKCVITDIACSAPSGGQNSFASLPDPVGVYITIKEYGAGRTADTCCIKEMGKKGKDATKSEADKFIHALKDFISSDFSTNGYLKRIYTGEDAGEIEKACDKIEHMNWENAVNCVGELIDERF